MMELEIGQKVTILIGKETSLGFVVLIEESLEGLVYKSEVFSDLEEGFSSEFQSSMNTDFTEDVFPDTRIEPKDAFQIDEDDVPF